MIEFDKKIIEIKDRLEKAKNAKIRAEARLEQLSRQRDEIVKELESMGIKEEQLQEEISRLRTEMEESIIKAEQLIPKGIKM